jgi:hypothetical protein
MANANGAFIPHVAPQTFGIPITSFRSRPPSSTESFGT